jgi:cysteine desulfurase
MQPSHVLTAMQTPAELIRGAIRFSLSRETTADEIERVVEIACDVVGKLRAAAAPLTRPELVA